MGSRRKCPVTVLFEVKQFQQIAKLVKVKNNTVVDCKPGPSHVDCLQFYTDIFKNNLFEDSNSWYTICYKHIGHHIEDPASPHSETKI